MVIKHMKKAFSYLYCFKGFLDHVTVLIGIAVKGVATAGVINQPFHNFEEIPKYGKARCIWGVQGLGKLLDYNKY